MKKNLCLLALFAFAAAVPAAETQKAELDDRIRKLAGKLEALQESPDKRIPPEVLAKAQGVVLFDRTKAGFIFAYQGGSGVALVRQGKSDKWSAPAFFNASEASLGFQAGGQQAFMAILLMNTNATAGLLKPSYDFGGEARGTAGDASTGTEGSLTETNRAVLIYTDRKGLYGGAAVKGSTIMADEKANAAYYGQYLTTKEILFDKKAKPTDTALELAKKINQHAKPVKK